MGIIETIKMLAREEGVEIGRKGAVKDILKSFILNTDCDNQKIAALCNVEVSTVKQMRQDLNI